MFLFLVLFSKEKQWSKPVPFFKTNKKIWNFWIWIIQAINIGTYKNNINNNRWIPYLRKNWLLPRILRYSFCSSPTKLLDTLTSGRTGSCRVSWDSPPAAAGSAGSVSPSCHRDSNRVEGGFLILFLPLTLKLSRIRLYGTLLLHQTNQRMK